KSPPNSSAHPPPSDSTKMFSKLLFRIPLRSKEEKIESVKQHQGLMIFNSDTMNHNNEFLLLPEESCLAEDEKSIFHVHCERAGFRLFGWGDVNFNCLEAKIYLTNYRVPFPPTFLSNDIVNFYTASPC